MLIYYSDTHGRGSPFHPDRVLTPTMFKEMMEDMEETERYHKMMWLVEATYGDYAFYPARDFDNVVALTLKDIPDSSQFVFIFPNEKNKEKIALPGVCVGGQLGVAAAAGAGQVDALPDADRGVGDAAGSRRAATSGHLVQEQGDGDQAVRLHSVDGAWGRDRRVSCRESSGLRGEDEEDEREGSPAPYDERIHREHERHYSLLLYACEAATVLALY